MSIHITHFGHACVLVETAGGSRLLFDPGTLSAGFEALIGLDAVLITHQHADHADLGRLPTLLAANPAAALIVDVGTAKSTVNALTGVAVMIAEPGRTLAVGGANVIVGGGEHAVVHPEIPRPPNCTYLVDDGSFFHPGDSFDLPLADVDVLGLPTSGPWLEVAEAVEYFRAVRPRVAVPIHEAALADTTTVYGMLRSLAPSGAVFAPAPPGTPTKI